MPAKQYILKLMPDERGELASLVRRGHCAGWKIQRAQALLAMDASEDGPAWIDARIAEAYGCTSRAVEMWRKLAVEEGSVSLMVRPRAAFARVVQRQENRALKETKAVHQVRMEVGREGIPVILGALELLARLLEPRVVVGEHAPIPRNVSQRLRKSARKESLRIPRRP